MVIAIIFVVTIRCISQPLDCAMYIVCNLLKILFRKAEPKVKILIADVVQTDTHL
jgi:hypothetical protein